MVDGLIEHLPHLIMIPRLPEDPHELSRDGLGRHVERLKHLRAFADLVPDLINADVAALVLHLRGQNDGLAALNALLQHGQEVIPVIRRDAAHAEAFQDQRIVVPEHPARKLRPRAGNELQERNALVERVIEDRLGQAGVFDILQNAAVLQNSQIRIIDAGEGLVALCARFAGAGALNDLAVASARQSG